MKHFLWLFILIPLVCYGADSKITDLPDVGASSDDVMYVVDNPGLSTASDNKITLGNLLLFFATQDMTLTGTIDASGATITFPTSITLDTPTFTLADDSTITLPGAASDYAGGLLSCDTDGTCGWTNPSSLLTSVDLSSVTISGGTASRMAEWDGSGNLTSSDTATTGTGAPVKGTGPTISLGENSTINNGASPTVNAAGEVAIDTTTDQIRWYGTAQQQLSPKLTFSVVVPSVADTDDMLIMKAPYGMTITALDCIVSAATSATINIQECDSAGASCVDTATSDLACDTDGANTTTLNNAVVDSGDWLKLDVASISGTPGTLTVTVTYTIVAD
jgi:hypothetical protein